MPGVIPIIILDAYCAHIMATIVNQIQSLWIKLIHIPVDGMYLCQPIAVGINKSIKNGMQENWEDWMLVGEGIVHHATKEPLRQFVVEWLVDVYGSILTETVRNAWMKRGYEWC